MNLNISSIWANDEMSFCFILYPKHSIEAIV